MYTDTCYKAEIRFKRRELSVYYNMTNITDPRPKIEVAEIVDIDTGNKHVKNGPFWNQVVKYLETVPRTEEGFISDED